LTSFFIYNDGIKTVIVFAAIYGAQRFSMSGSQLIIYFVLANITSFIGALIFGYIVDRIGAKKQYQFHCLSGLLWLSGHFSVPI